MPLCVCACVQIKFLSQQKVQFQHTTVLWFARIKVKQPANLLSFPEALIPKGGVTIQLKRNAVAICEN